MLYLKNTESTKFELSIKLSLHEKPSFIMHGIHKVFQHLASKECLREI